MRQGWIDLCSRSFLGLQRSGGGAVRLVEAQIQAGDREAWLRAVAWKWRGGEGGAKERWEVGGGESEVSTKPLLLLRSLS